MGLTGRLKEGSPKVNETKPQHETNDTASNGDYETRPKERLVTRDYDEDEKDGVGECDEEDM